MNELRSLFQPGKAESSRSQGTTNIIAPSSNFNHVVGQQYNINVHPAPLAHASGIQPPDQAPFNDAPVDNLSIHFTGRERELALIAKAFEQRRNIPVRCALFGNQGVGKSQLTYSWAKSTFDRKENAYILWMSATTVEKLFQGFCRLLRFVNHPDQSHPDQNARLEAARRWLEEVDTGNWLLVFDNVFPETVDFLRKNLPRVNGRGTILFATRTRDVAVAVTSTAGERHHVIEVPLLRVEEAVELFCGHFDAGKVDPLSEKVEAIVKAVGCLPLAISHAAAYMEQSRISLDNLLGLYQSKHKIDVIAWEHTLSDYEHKSVAATFTSQLRDLERQHPDACKLLRVLAFLDPESIPLEMLIVGARAIAEDQPLPTRTSFKTLLLSVLKSPKTITRVKQRPAQSASRTSLLALLQSPIACQNAITQLQTRCLLTYHGATSQSPMFRIHDLIQLVVLENVRNSGLDEELLELAAELVRAAFGKIKDPLSPESWPQCELLVPHIQVLADRITSSKAKQALLPAVHSQGSYLSSQGRFVEAESLYKKVVEDTEQLFGFDDLRTLAAMHELARVYQCRGRYVDAETLFNRVLKSGEFRRNPEHPSTLATMYHLAIVYYEQLRYDDAEALLEQTLQRQESQFGSEDNHTLYIMHMLANVYQAQERYDNAESLLKRVLLAREQLFGSEHYATLMAKGSLARVYLSQQRHDVAAALFEQVLRASERILGPEHPHTLLTMYFLALVYASQHCDAEAEKLLVHVLASRDKVYDVSHPDTQATIRELLLVYQRLGRVDEARMLKERMSLSL